MHSHETSSLTELEVTSHEQVQQTASFTSGRGQARVAAAQDLVAQRGAEERVAAEEQSREFADESPQGGESVADDGLALERRVQQGYQDVE